MTAIAATMIASTCIFFACSKEEENTVKNGMFESKLKSNSSDFNTAVIVTVKTGKKKKVDEHYDCHGFKGMCWLWFGGLFTIDNVSQIFEIGSKENCASGYFGEQYMKDDEPIAICLTNFEEQCIDMLFDFSCCNDDLNDTYFEEIESGIVDFNDNMIIDDEEWLNSHEMKSPIFIPMGTYPILKSFVEKNQYYIKVPFKKM